MIRVVVNTTMEFKDAEELERYLASDVQAKITGFSREVRTAWETKRPYAVETPRPEHGVVARSDIVVEESP